LAGELSSRAAPAYWNVWERIACPVPAECAADADGKPSALGFGL
jgi:hypothetical protein